MQRAAFGREHEYPVPQHPAGTGHHGYSERGPSARRGSGRHFSRGVHYPRDRGQLMVEKVTLRHPHTKDTVEVAATPAALVPYMVQGYEQIKPATPAEGE